LNETVRAAVLAEYEAQDFDPAAKGST